MKHTILFLLIFFFSFGAFAQNYYDRIYDFGDTDHPLAITVDSAGNNYVCGWYEDGDNGAPHAFVFKTGADGQELWRKTVEDTSKFYALCLTHTGSLILAGSSDNHCYLTSWDSQTGDEIWVYEETDSENYWFATVDEFVDSTGYKLFVRKEVNGTHKIRYLLIEPLSGNLLLEHIDINTVNGVAYTSGLIAPDKVFTAGDWAEGIGFVWYKNFGDGPCQGTYWTFNSLHIAGVHKYNAGRGCVVDYFNLSNKNWLEVLTMDFNITSIWGNSFLIAHDTFEVAGSGKYENGNFVITGTIDSVLALWFIDHELDGMKEKIIDTDQRRSGVDVVCLPSQDMVIMGTEHAGNNESATDVFLMKRNYDGLVSTPEHHFRENITLYPNPVTNRFYLKSSGYNLNGAKAYIVNSTGQTVKTVTNLLGPVTVSDLPEGLYVMMVLGDGKVVFNKKFVKN